MTRFFEKNGEYNPHFCYKAIVSPEVIQLHTEYEDLANKILINNKHQISLLPVLSEEEVVKEIKQYLDKLGLEEYVEIKF